MALGTKQVTSLTTAQLKEGLNRIVDECLDHEYKGRFQDIFKTIAHDKIVYEIVKLAGFGIAGLGSEGAPISSFDTVNQSAYKAPRLLKYEKAARMTLESDIFNLYDSVKIGRLAREIAKAHLARRDLECAQIFNRSTTSGYTWLDGKVLLATDHPIQAGGTQSNLVSQNLDEDALEDARVAVYNMKNDDGLVGDYMPKGLVIPVEQMHDARRLLKLDLQPFTANNTPNINKDFGDMNSVIIWKRLNHTDSWYVLTNYDEAFVVAEKMKPSVETFKDNYTRDTIITSVSFAVPIAIDPVRAVVGYGGA